MKILGNTVGTAVIRTNYEQTDSTKADYLIGKDVLDQKIEGAKTAAENAQTATGKNLQKTGGTMEGPIDMGGQKLSGLNDPEEDGEAASWGAVKEAVNAHAEKKDNPHDVTAAQVGAVEKKLLWTNASSGSAFDAQTVSLDLSEYSYVEILYRAGAGGAWKSQVCLVSLTVLLDGVCGSSGTTGGAYCFSVFRTGTVSGTGINFSKAYTVKQHGTDTAEFTENNHWAVPFMIFGIKGVT